MLADLTGRTGASDVMTTFDFPIFLERKGPISGGEALVPFDCTIGAELRGEDAAALITVRVPITSLCPCSREISDYGAHNQRGLVEITVGFSLDEASAPVDLSDLVKAAESAGSAPIYTLLKRTDERFVTMRAYENPAFVEDITRQVAATLKRDSRIRTGRVRVVNEESIHSHNAYAAVKWGPLA
jgi:GTP cyclohydrolase I